MKRVLLFLFALALASFASAGQSSKVDVTGKWLFNVQTDAGSGTPTVTLKQDGEKLTGHYSSQNFGEQELTGTVKGNDFAPTVSLGYGGTLAKGFTIGAELGVMFQGSPKIQNYQATGLLASNPAFQSDLQIERARVEDKVHSYQYWPIAQIELLYRF